MVPPHVLRVQAVSQVDAGRLMAAHAKGRSKLLPLPAQFDGGFGNVDRQMALLDHDLLLDLERVVEEAIPVALPTVEQDNRAASRPIHFGQRVAAHGERASQESRRHLFPMLVAERHDPKVRVGDNLARHLDVVDADVVERGLAYRRDAELRSRLAEQDCHRLLVFGLEHKLHGLVDEYVRLPLVLRDRRRSRRFLRVRWHVSDIVLILRAVSL